MKKLMLMVSLSGLITFSLTSCGKEEKPAVKVEFTVQLTPDQAYTFILPDNKRHDEFEFTTQASHYSVSALGENTLGQQIYQYTPAANYTGTDEVVVNNDYERYEEHHMGGPHMGGCMGGEEDHYIVTIHFVIRGTNSNAGTVK